MNIVIARLLGYSFNPIDWDYEKLTEHEKEIIENQYVLDEIHDMVQEEFDHFNEVTT